MSQKRPSAVTVVAVLHFIFGGCGLVCGTCMLGGLVLAGSGGMKNFQKGMVQGPEGAKQLEFQEEVERVAKEKNPSGQLVQGVQLAIGLVLSCVLVVAGFGLLKMRPWARAASIGYGVVSILLGIFNIISIMAVAMPAWEEVRQVMEPQAQGQNKAVLDMASLLAGPGAIGIAIFGLIYPAAVLLIMFWPTVAAAFRGDAPAGESAEDEHRPEDRWSV